MGMRRVTVEQIREALAACSGNVLRTAKVLGIARNNLYKHMANKQISPGEHRPARGGDSQHKPVVTADAHATVAQLGTAGRIGRTSPTAAAVSSTATSKPQGRCVAFPIVSTPSMAAEQVEQPKQLRLSRSVYLRPDQVKALDDACLDLPAVLREKLSPSKVLERFIDDCWVTWLRSKLDAAAKPQAKRGRKAEASE